jgi:dihydrofolate reductase
MIRNKGVTGSNPVSSTENRQLAKSSAGEIWQILARPHFVHHHDGVPIHILSRNPAPAWAAEWPAVHYVNDLETAVQDAKHAAGDRHVLVHGASVAQRALSAGCLDELEIHLIPVLFGEGRRLFEHLRH